MADINILKPYILKWEGGFVNDPTDRGGTTNMGVTFNTFKDYRKRKGLPEPTIGDLKNSGRTSCGHFTGTGRKLMT